MNRNMMTENSQGHSLPSSPTPPLPTLDLSHSDFLERREEGQLAELMCTNGTTLENAPDAPNAQNAAVHQCKSTRENFGKPAKKYSDFYLYRHYINLD